MRVPVVLLSFVLAIPAVARDPDVPPHDGWLPLPTLVSDETKPQEPDTIMFASIPGKCSTLKVAGRDFACRAVAYYQTEEAVEILSSLSTIRMTIITSSPSPETMAGSQRTICSNYRSIRCCLNPKTDRRSMDCQRHSLNRRLEYASRLETSRRGWSPVSTASRSARMAKSTNCSSSLTARRLH